MRTATQQTLFNYVLRHADDCLILSQRLGDLVSRAPELEEDIALANIALDVLGTGRRLLQYAGEIEGDGRTEDDLAFGRNEREFTNLLLTETPNGDFGQTMARQFLFDAYHDLLWNRLIESTDETIAGIAGKARKESAYHLRHSRLWVLRLGDGTEESHRRMQAGLDAVWRFTGEMFIDDEVDLAAADAGYGVLPSTLRDDWQATTSQAIAEATLEIPDDTSIRTGGRRGEHSEGMGPLLAEMQHMYRSFPGASW
ncbi:MAG: phenylacetate-CoA oxygenase subunit PaaC [Acidimicrobiia bacterium]|nr:phenylacetate-CoA oxygenase subunit PaaC [Acidimicrobiia bacterium]